MTDETTEQNLSKAGEYDLCFIFSGAPGGARFLRVQVPSLPGSGKDIAEGEGVHREVESELSQ